MLEFQREVTGTQLTAISSIELDPMGVLVTGGAGYIGSHMVLRLLDAGEDVLVLDNLSTGFRWSVPDDAKFVEGDVGDHNLVISLLLRNPIDAMIHFAGSIVVPESISDPLGYYLNNTCKSRALIACAVETKVSLSSSPRPRPFTACRRAIPSARMPGLKPISPYGSSKLMTEIMLRDAARAHDLRYVALRYFNVAGADPLGRSGQSTAHATHLIKVAAQTALGKTAVPRSVRHRLSHARWHMRAGLHPCQRSD